MISLALEPDFDFCGPSYRNLFANASAATAFQHPLWLAAIHRQLVPAFQARPLTITGRDEFTGELALVFPLVRRRKYGISIMEYADFGVTDYCAPVIRIGREREIVANSCLSVQLRCLAGRSDMFRIKAVRPEHMPAVAALTGLSPQITDNSSHEVAMRAPFDEWRRATFAKGHRNQIDGSRRRLGRLGKMAFDRLTDASHAERAIAELRALRSGRFDGDPLEADAVCAFYKGIAASGAQCGFSQTHRLSHDGNTVGVGLGITHAGRFHGILIACDYDKYRKFSPGLLMYDNIMQDWLRSGGTMFDFNVGEASYKQKFGTDAVPVFGFQSALTVTGHAARRAMGLKRHLSSTLARNRLLKNRTGTGG